MINLKAKITGLKKGREETLDKTKKVLMLSMFKMEELAVKNSPFDTGFLRQNITLFPQILADRYVLTSRAPYSADLEFGNTPRDVKTVDIAEWVKRKGIATDAGAIISATNYIVDKIKREGVNAQPFMRPAFHEVVNFWQVKFKDQVFQ